MSGCYSQLPLQNVNFAVFFLPLPPAHGGGVVKFGRVFVSIANFGTKPVEIGIRLIKADGTESNFNKTVPVGRTVVAEPQPSDVACQVTAEISAVGQTQVILAALVEYETPGDPGAQIP